MLRTAENLTAAVLWNFLAPITLAAVFSPSAHAVPSYSRQTGLACSSCHYTPPELTPFGRKFKLEGYTFATKPEVSEDKRPQFQPASAGGVSAFRRIRYFFHFDQSTRARHAKRELRVSPGPFRCFWRVRGRST
jgi:hypothetical protein